MNTLHDEQLDGPVGPEKADRKPIGRRGFAELSCLSCGERTVWVHMAEVTTFCCTNDDCEAEWTAAEVEANVSAWMDALAWVRSAPPLP